MKQRLKIWKKVSTMRGAILQEVQMRYAENRVGSDPKAK